VVEDYWVSRQLLGPIQALARQGVPVLFIFGTEDHHYHDFLLARTGRLGRALEAAPNTEVRVIEGLVHGYTRVDMQDRIARTILEWLGRHVAAPDPVRA
jgi:pimeloyl-ACP methyl ester carboxylesterase